MKATQLLQVIYSFFLGLVVLAVVAISLNTFWPRPPWPSAAENSDAVLAEYDRAVEAWTLTTSVALLVAATMILAISLIRSNRLAVISNGLLLGGIFTMIYAVGMSAGGERSIPRLIVVVIALIVTVAVGYLTFVRGRSETGTPVASSGDASEIVARVDALERRLEALGRALIE